MQWHSNSDDIDFIALQNLVFDWADSTDMKDWERLKRCLAPAVTLDNSRFGIGTHENLTPDQYMGILKPILGRPTIQTQHIIGASKWERLEDGRVYAVHQVRASHQSFTDETLTKAVNKGHGHGQAEHWYQKVDGAWKIVYNRPSSNWVEGDLWATLDPAQTTPKEA